MIQMNLWARCVSAAILLASAISFAQQPLALADYKAKYPDISELVLDHSQRYDISIVNRKLQVIQHNYYESMILTDIGINSNWESFSYSELVKNIGYDAYSVISQNGKDKKIKVTQVNEKQSRNNGIFHDDVKERQIIFPNLEVGARKVMQYQSEFLDPHLLHKFVFGTGIPVENSKFEIVTDKGIEIGYKIFNDKDSRIQFCKSEKKGKIVYTWIAKGMPALKMEDYSPGILYVAPHINVYIKEFQSGDQKIQLLDDTAKLFAYYKGFISNVNILEDAELKQLSMEITRDKATEEEKVKTIFYWVKDNIKYIAFENGYEGFIPRDASLVFDRKFGDCKDMSSILVSMASYAGVEDVSLCWIGTRNIPYTYGDLSTPAVDDHMIAAYRRKGGTYIFLDATDKESRYGIPTPFIQEKEAMINRGDSFEIVRVPSVTPRENLLEENLKLTIDGDRLVGEGQVSFSGHVRSRALSEIGDASGKSRFEIVKTILLKGNNKFQLTSFNEQNNKDRDKPFLIDHKFDIGSYVISADDEQYVNMCLYKPYEKHLIEKNRQSVYSFDFLMSRNSVYTLDAGKRQVLSVPDNFELDNPLLTAKITYEKNGSTVTARILVDIKKMMIEHKDFELWNESIRKLKSKYNETIVLKQKS